MYQAIRIRVHMPFRPMRCSHVWCGRVYRHSGSQRRGYVYIYIYMYVCMYVCMYVYVYVYVYVYIYIYIHTSYIYIYTYALLYTYVYIHIISLYICVCVYIYIHNGKAMTKSTKSVAGEQFLLPGCRAKARMKGDTFSQTPVRKPSCVFLAASGNIRPISVLTL